MDNKGTVDLASNWRIGGSIWYIYVTKAFLTRVKNKRIAQDWVCTGEENNLPGPKFAEHVPNYFWGNEYRKQAPDMKKKLAGEGLSGGKYATRCSESRNRVTIEGFETITGLELQRE